MRLYHKGQTLIPKTHAVNSQCLPYNSHHLPRALVCRDLAQFGVFHTFSSLLEVCHSCVSVHFSPFKVESECMEQK